MNNLTRMLMKVLIIFIKKNHEESNLLKVLCRHFKTFFITRCDVLCSKSLNIEIAEKVVKYDQVIFIDTAENIYLGNFFWKNILPADHFINTSFKKQIDPPVLLSYLRYVYGFVPKSFMCVIGAATKNLNPDIEGTKNKLYNEMEEFLEERLLSSV